MDFVNNYLSSINFFSKNLILKNNNETSLACPESAEEIVTSIASNVIIEVNLVSIKDENVLNVGLSKFSEAQKPFGFIELQDEFNFAHIQLLHEPVILDPEIHVGYMFGGGRVDKAVLPEIDIDTGTAKPRWSQPYVTSEVKTKIILEQCQEWLEAGIVSHSKSPWASLVVLGS